MGIAATTVVEVQGAEIAAATNTRLKYILSKGPLVSSGPFLLELDHELSNSFIPYQTPQHIYVGY